MARKYEEADNFDVIINVDKGDLEIWKNREVVKDGKVENPIIDCGRNAQRSGRSKLPLATAAAAEATMTTRQCHVLGELAVVPLFARAPRAQGGAAQHGHRDLCR